MELGRKMIQEVRSKAEIPASQMEERPSRQGNSIRHRPRDVTVPTRKHRTASSAWMGEGSREKQDMIDWN